MTLYALHKYYIDVAYGARESSHMKILHVIDFASVMEQRRVSSYGRSRLAIYACSENYKFEETRVDSMRITIRTPVRKR